MISQATPQQEKPNIKSWWLPLVVGLILCMLVIGMWRMLEQQESANRRNKIEAESDYLGSRVESDLKNRIPDLQRMVRSWELRQGTRKDEFITEAQSYLSDVPGFQALEWVDKNSYVRWIIPMEGNEKALDLNLSFERNRWAAMVKARESGSPAMTLPVNLVQGGKGFLMFFPIYLRGDFAGYILAVFRVQEWLDYVFNIKSPKALSEDFRISVFFDETPIYEQAGWEKLEKNDTRIVSMASILDHDLYIHIRPTDDFIKSNESPLPALVLVFGGLMSLLVAFVVWLYQKSNMAAWRAHASKKALEGEIMERKLVEVELQRAFLRMDLATKAARMGLWTWDLTNDTLNWNDRMFELMDIPLDVKPTYATWRTSIHPDDLPHAESLLENAVRGKATFDTEFRIVHSDGAVHSVRAAARVERDAEGKPRSVTGLNWDISRTKESEAALKASEEKVRLLLNSTAEAIYGIDLEGNCTFANPSCARMLGYPDTETLIGRNMHRLAHHTHPDGRPMPVEECRIYRAFRDGKPMHVDDEVLWRPDGTSFPVEYWSYPQIVHDRVQGAVVTFIDITERRKAEDTIRHLATHDELTDLPNVRLYRDRLTMAMNSARRDKSQVAVIMLDLDGFKNVNDLHGHDMGDDVLKEVAKRLRSAVRETDSVARMGGDEFLLAITGLQMPDMVAPIAEKMIQLVSRPIISRGKEVSVCASIGVAFFPRDADSVDTLIKLADQTMYRVKKNGKNAFGYAGRVI